MAFVVCGASTRAARAQGPSDVPASLAKIDDLRALTAQVGRQQRPLLLFFSLPGCGFCLQVRRDHLGPRARETGDSGPLIREIDITSRREFIGADGRPVRENDFAERHKVRMVPHVVLVDGDLKPLAEPLIGIGVADFYDAYLSDAIESATRKLRGRKSGAVGRATP